MNRVTSAMLSALRQHMEVRPEESPLLCGPVELAGAIFQTCYNMPDEPADPAVMQAVRHAVASFVRPNETVRFWGMTIDATNFDDTPIQLQHGADGKFKVHFHAAGLAVYVVPTIYPEVWVVTDNTDPEARVELWVGCAERGVD